MKILISLNGELNIDIKQLLKATKIDYIIGVDGGYNHLKEHNIDADLLIGDLDSVATVDVDNVIALNPVKDETDFLAAINYVNDHFKVCEILVIGFISNKRPEHFYNNLKHLTPSMTFISQDTMINYLGAGTHTLNLINHKYLSIFSIYDDTTIDIKNAKYELDCKLVSINDTYTISNEALAGNEPIILKIDKPCLIFKSV